MGGIHIQVAYEKYKVNDGLDIYILTKTVPFSFQALHHDHNKNVQSIKTHILFQLKFLPSTKY